MAAPFLTIPNYLSGSRYVLAPILLLAIIGESWWVGLIVFYVAVLTDLLDGLVARRLNQASAIGAKLDHSADAVFVFCGLAALSVIGSITWFLCIVQSVSFLLYFAESTMPNRPLRPSILGKANGIAYFFIVGIPITQNSLALDLITPSVLTLLAWALVVSSLISIVQRYVSRIAVK